MYAERWEGQYDGDEGAQGTAGAFLGEGQEAHWDEGPREDQEAPETGIKLKVYTCSCVKYIVLINSLPVGVY